MCLTRVVWCVLPMTIVQLVSGNHNNSVACVNHILQGNPLCACARIRVMYTFVQSQFIVQSGKENCINSNCINKILNELLFPWSICNTFIPQEKLNWFNWLIIECQRHTSVLQGTNPQRHTWLAKKSLKRRSPVQTNYQIINIIIILRGLFWNHSNQW
jgi:hypothetical protein